MKQPSLKNTKSVFISRELKAYSPFREQLESAGYQVKGTSFLRFEAVPFTTYPTTDWIFFYSRKAVTFFITQIDKLPAGVRIAAYGSGTAAALKAEGITVHFTGTGAGATTTPSFLKIAKTQSVLFPQARHSRRTVEELSGNQIKSSPLIVYDNQIKESVPIQQAKTLVFTSPLNATAYFQKYKLQDYQSIVVIGEATAAAVRKLGIQEMVIAEEASEEGLAAGVLYLDKDQ